MPTLILGNKNYSSWSLRGWLALRWAGIDFEETVVPLQQEGSAEEKARLSPSGLVPALHLDDGTVVWDSLAIGEWAHEQTGRLWPDDSTRRAVARSVACEMHSGFLGVRSAMPMNLGRQALGFTPPDDARRDIDRMTALWADTSARFGGDGPFLFGARCLADVMFAPVATRLRTYGVAVDGQAKAYVEALLGDPDLQQWTDEARKEPWSIPVYDDRE